MMAHARITLSLLARLTVLGLFGPALLFASSGDLGWFAGWGYSIFALVYTVVGRLVLFTKNPDLAAERASGFRRPDIEPWDRRIVPWIGLILPTLTMIAAGLDHRLSTGSHFPVWVQAAAAAPVAAGASLGLWAALTCPFFSSVARIQADRGQRVISAGPYGWVRHPGYAGTIVFNLASPLVLDSSWAFLPVVPIVVLTILRTRFEDRMLREKLEGYEDYAGRTRFRLIPGIW
jgi:protein-S-isoprenylcysteine O-methyltransferase Ste14